MTGENQRARSSEWSPGDTARVFWVALVPTLLAVVVSIPGVDTPVDNEVLGTWYFVGLLGSVVFVPAALISLLGAAALRRRFRLGRVISTVGALAVLVMCCLMGLVAVSEATTGDELSDPNSWGGSLGVGESVIFAVPFVLIAAANCWLLTHLWLPNRERG